MAESRERTASCGGSGRAGTPSRRRCARTTRASSSCRTRARRSSASPTPARCGGRSTTCRPMQFTKELDRLWEQVRPLYCKLHAYVADEAPRRSTATRFRPSGPTAGPPARQHLGTGLEQRLPARRARQRRRRLLADRHPQATQDQRRSTWSEIGERFYTSLGFAPLPETFWKRSLFVRPQDREVVCHASAWDIDLEDDIRIKMCIEPDGGGLLRRSTTSSGTTSISAPTRAQPVIFRDSANDGFHEAIGDTIALSVTPEYLVQIGLLDKAPDASRDIGLLMRARWRRLPSCRSAC